jgi:hypothetical protein
MVTSGSGGSVTAVAAAAGKVPVPLLTRTIYSAWAMRMKYLMRVHGAWGAQQEGDAHAKEVLHVLEEVAGGELDGRGCGPCRQWAI